MIIAASIPPFFCADSVGRGAGGGGGEAALGIALNDRLVRVRMRTPERARAIPGEGFIITPAAYSLAIVAT